MKVLYYDKNNPDHVLFCLLYNELYNVENNVIFIDFYNLFDTTLLPQVEDFTVIFLEHIPFKEWFDNIQLEDLKITEVMLYTNKSLKLTQFGGTDDVIENIYESTVIKYEGIFINYILVNGKLSKYLFNLQTGMSNSPKRSNYNVLGIIIASYCATNITKDFDNKQAILIQMLCKKLISGNSIEVMSRNIYKDGIVSLINQIFFSLDITDNVFYQNLTKKFLKVSRDINFRVITLDTDRKYISTVNDKIEYLNHVDNVEVPVVRLIQILTTDIKQSLLEHNFIKASLKERYYVLFGFFKCDFIEYHNPITKQSVFISYDYVLNFNTSEDNDYTLTEKQLQYLADYYYKFVLNIVRPTTPLIVPNEINPLLTITITESDDYTNNIVNNLNIIYNENLNIH